MVTYRRVPIRLSDDFSKETLQATRDWQEVFKAMKSRDLQPRLLYPAKLSFRIEGQIKSFPGKKKLKEFIITKHYYVKCYRDLLKKKKKIKTMNNKITINTHLSTIDSKKETKQTIRTETEAWIQRMF